MDNFQVSLNFTELKLAKNMSASNNTSPSNITSDDMKPAQNIASLHRNVPPSFTTVQHTTKMCDTEGCTKNGLEKSVHFPHKNFCMDRMKKLIMD